MLGKDWCSICRMKIATCVIEQTECCNECALKILLKKGGSKRVK